MRSELDDLSYFRYTSKGQLDKYLHTLEGIIKGVAIDRKINQLELKELQSWCNDYINIANRHPFSEILPVIYSALEDGYFDNEEVENILWLCENLYTENNYYDVITSDMQRLHGILHGIIADNCIDIIELKKLNQWLDENDHLKGIYPYDELESIIIKVLQDGIIDFEENKLLKLFFSDFVTPSQLSNISQDEIKQLKQEMTIPGICSICPQIDFKDNTFCFTGISSKAKRSEIADLIESLGGNYNDNVIERTKYLIVGNNGNQCWTFSCYGRKVEKAVNMRKHGFEMVIVNENDFWDAVEEYK